MDIHCPCFKNLKSQKSSSVATVSLLQADASIYSNQPNRAARFLVFLFDQLVNGELASAQALQQQHASSHPQISHKVRPDLRCEVPAQHQITVNTQEAVNRET